MKRALIIPGYKQGPFTPQMRRVARTLHKNGVDASIARVNWRGRTLTEWLQGMEVVLRNIDLSDTTLIGFSHGAMIATLVASRQTPDHLILCSLPDYWAEDPSVSHPSKSKWLMRRKQMLDYRAYRFKDIAPHIYCPTTILLQESEALRSHGLLARAQAAEELIENAMFSQVNDYTKTIGQLAHPHQELRALETQPA